MRRSDSEGGRHSSVHLGPQVGSEETRARATEHENSYTVAHSADASGDEADGKDSDPVLASTLL